MQHLSLYETFSLTEEVIGNRQIDQALDPDQQGMVYGIIDLLKRVHDLGNRQEIADHMVTQFKQDGIEFDYSQFYAMCGCKPVN